MRANDELGQPSFPITSRARRNGNCVLFFILRLLFLFLFFFFLFPRAILALLSPGARFRVTSLIKCSRRRRLSRCVRLTVRPFFAVRARSLRGSQSSSLRDERGTEDPRSRVSSSSPSSLDPRATYLLSRTRSARRVHAQFAIHVVSLSARRTRNFQDRRGSHISLRYDDTARAILASTQTEKAPGRIPAFSSWYSARALSRRSP